MGAACAWVWWHFKKDHAARRTTQSTTKKLQMPAQAPGTGHWLPGQYLALQCRLHTALCTSIHAPSGAGVLAASPEEEAAPSPSPSLQSAKSSSGCLLSSPAGSMRPRVVALPQKERATSNKQQATTTTAASNNNSSKRQATSNKRQPPTTTQTKCGRTMHTTSNNKQQQPKQEQTHIAHNKQQQATTTQTRADAQCTQQTATINKQQQAGHHVSWQKAGQLPTSSTPTQATPACCELAFDRPPTRH